MDKKVKSLIIVLVIIPCFIYGVDTSSIQKIASDKISSNIEECAYPKPNIKKITNKLDSEQFGDQRDFWTLNVIESMYEQVHATLLAVGTWCYIYMDNRTIEQEGQNNAIQKCETYAEEFDNNIYSKNIEFMGNPDGSLGDIDGDPRVTTLIYPIQGGGGLYLEVNEIEHMYSNQREMVYIHSVFNPTRGIPTLCHEFNHLIIFNSDWNEADFILEGLAEYSCYYAGYFSDESYIHSSNKLNLSHHANHYEDYPETSLLFFDPSSPELTYGASYMLFFYLVEQYGIQVITDLITLETDGPEALEEALLTNGFDISFNELFLNWIVACTIDQSGIYSDLYCFRNAEFRVSKSTLITSLPFTKVDAKHNFYGLNVKRIETPPDEFIFQIETPDESKSLGVCSIVLDDNGWNVTKTILDGDIGLVELEFSGKNIQTAYILTSLIEENIKEAPREFIEAPYEYLDYSFHTEKMTTEKTDFNIYVTFVLAVCVASMNLIKRKILVQKSNNRIK